MQPDPSQPIPPSLWDRVGQSLTIATIFGFITQALGASVRSVALFSILGLLISIAVSYILQKQPHLIQTLYSSRLSPSVLIAIVLASVLAGSLLRQHSMDAQMTDLGEISDTLHWRLFFCFHREECIVNRLAELPHEVSAKSDDPSEKLFADQALGEVIRSSPVAMEWFNRSYGVYADKFLGTGESLQSGMNFTDARIPEYLVPNYPENHNNVLVWRLKPGDSELDDSLMGLIDRPPYHETNDVEAIRRRIKSQLKSQTEAQAHLLVRFAMVPDLEKARSQPNIKYSGCFARKERKRAFFSSLAYMMKHTSKVKEAGELSGYRFVQGSGNEVQYLYIFVFAPDNSSEYMEPTWTNLLLHMSETSACTQTVGP